MVCGFRKKQQQITTGRSVVLLALQILMASVVEGKYAATRCLVLVLFAHRQACVYEAVVVCPGMLLARLRSAQRSTQLFDQCRFIAFCFTRSQLRKRQVLHVVSSKMNN